MKTKNLIISTMKDEGPFILEWLAYHRLIGFNEFLIYTNDCSDGTDLMLDRLQSRGLVRHERNEVLRRGAHKSALKYAMDHPLYAMADWVYVTDADEFLNIHAGKGELPDLFAAYPDANVIPVTWRMFSFARKEVLGDGLMIEELCDAQPAQAQNGEKPRFVKSVFRPQPGIERLGLHAPVFSEDAEEFAVWGGPSSTTTPDAKPDRPDREFGYDIAQVNHYALRSLDAYLFKKHRGRANHMSQDLGIGYWARWNLGGERDTSIHRFLPALKSEIETLCQDPVLRHLHLGAVEFHNKRIEELKSIPEYAALRQEIAARENLTLSVRKPESTAPDSDNPPTTGRRRANRLRMLGEMPKRGRCAEIGVWNGGFSEDILDVTQPRELVLIDPWDLIAETSTETQTHKKHADAQAMRDMYDHVKNGVGARPETTLRKGFSEDILADYPDDYFDWVYIDGNHRYEFVYRDVRLAFDKVRPGGIIAGDDFFWKRDGRFHVREAVLQAMRDMGLKNRPTRFGQQFMITVPAKEPPSYYS